MMRRFCRAVLVRAALAGVGFAGAGIGTALAQKPGGSVTYASASRPSTLDPHNAGGMAELEIVHHLFEGLVAMDERYNMRPMLAAGIEIGDAARTYRFTLRKGVTFHDGDELDSADVLASFQRYAKVSPNAAMLADVASYETPDPATFVVRLKTTNAVFLEMLKTPTYPLVILREGSRNSDASEAEIIGTGPFRLRDWVPDKHLVLRRFEAYAADTGAERPDGLAGRKTAYLDRVRYRFTPDAEERLVALQAGQVDAVANLPPDLARRLDRHADVAVQKVFPFCQLLFVLHAGRGPTTDTLIRQAIRAAVNVDEILVASGTLAARNHSLVYPTSPYFAGDATRRFYDRHDPAEARRLLAQAGYRGQVVVLQTNSTFSYMRDAAALLAEQLKEAGFATEVQVVDWPANLRNLRTGEGNWNVTAAGLCSQPLMGPQQWRRVLMSYPHAPEDAVVDAAYGRFFTGLDLASRAAAWREIETRVLEQAYVVKVADLGVLRAVNTRLQGLTPYYFVRFWNAWLK